MLSRGYQGHGLLRILGWILRLCLFLAVLLAVLIALYRFVTPPSTLMLWRYVTGQKVERIVVPLNRISPHLIAAVVVSEDARFCLHKGVDWDALRGVLDKSGASGPSRGASTIPMQTAKNLFLWPSRSVIRKGIEIPLALGLDLVWPKRRILEIYLNIAEWGDGIFGIEAAARANFHKSAADLDRREAALLATALPNPFLRNPAAPRMRHQRLARHNLDETAYNAVPLACLK